MQETINKLKLMGLNLMPLQVKSKKPVGDWKHLQTERYEGSFPENCNVGVICGKISDNLYVLDLDSESLIGDFKEFNDKTFTVKTGKGYHFYFKSAIGNVPENRKFDDYKFRHVDIKSEGGYVLAPGSIHPDTGKPYTIVCDKPIMVLNPQIILDKLKVLGFNIEKLTLEQIKGGVKEGGRNDATFKYACYCVREFGLYGDSLKKALDDLNAKHSPPLSDFEIDLIIKQALRYEGSNVAPTKQILTIETLREKVKLLDKTEINICAEFADYVKELGEETVKDIILEHIPEAKITNSLVLGLQNINPADHEGIAVEFDAMIIAVGERRTYTREAEFVCPASEGERKQITCDEYHELHTPYCFKHKTGYMMDKSTKKTAFIQELRIQEFMENAKNNSPIEYDAEITDNSVGEAFFGDRKTFTAKLRSVEAKDGKNDIVFEIINMRDLDQKEGCLPTPEEIERWKNTPNMYEKVRDSIASEQYMEHMKEMKEGCMLAVVGGTSMNGKRSNINVGMIGDAQLGKSELGRAIHKIIPGSGLVMGGRTSGPGLTVSMVTLYSGVKIPQAGVLPRHNGKPVIFDEADKAKTQDIEAIYECMEQQTTTVTLSGTNGGITLPASCPIIMCANPKGGKFNPDFPRIMDNFSFPEPFVTRFDLLFLVIDQNNIDLDRKIRQHIRSYDASKYMKLDELQRYFAYARSLRATVPHELDHKVDALHAKMRPLNTQRGIPIGIRQYYGLYRLLTACAALHLREVVTDEDFAIVENIIKVSLKSMKMDIDTGKAEDVFRAEKTTKKEVFYVTWNKCMDKVDATVDKDELIEGLSKHELFRLTADSYFDELVRSGKVELDNATGRYKLVG